jgi:hypothetical protein
VETVLILAVLVGIALIFREYIFGFVADIMANIMGGDEKRPVNMRFLYFKILICSQFANAQEIFIGPS